MGNSQQIYVIAKINGRYRSLSALQHQDAYSASFALAKCLQQIELFRSFKNRSNLQHELEYAQSLPESFWDSPNEFQMNGGIAQIFSETTNKVDRVHQYIPFPFIITCHILSTTVNFEHSVAHHCNVYPFNFPFHKADWNDMINVLDITNLSNPSYCFASINRYDAGLRKIPFLTPLNATEFLAARNFEYEGPLRLWEVFDLEKFTSLPVIDFRVLKETWPRGNWKEGATDIKSDLQVEGENTNEKKLFMNGALIRYLQVVDRFLPLPTLRSMALKTLLDEILSSEADTDLAFLANAELLRHFLQEVKKRLYQDPRLLETSPNALALFAKIVAIDDEVDLSPFHTLDPAQLYQLLSHTKCTSLDLAGISCITPDVLVHILKKTQHLKSLNLMGIPNLSLDGLSPQLLGHGIRNLSHSQAFSKYFEYLMPGDHYRESSYPALQYGDVSPVVQLLYVHNAHSSDRQRLANGGLPLTRIDRGRGGRPNICSLPIYLGGNCLPVEKFVPGLVNLIKLQQLPPGNNESICSTTAKAFALAGSLQKSTVLYLDPWTVDPLPALAYTPSDPHCNPSSIVLPPPTKTIKPG